jgi:hypothetical protein
MMVVAGSSAWADRRGRGGRGRDKAKEEETPWSQGVPKEAQRRALQLFREGNALFEQAKYTEAVAVYEQALASWDHPNIRFNMASCLINMRQPLAAWTHLERALRFGEAPLGERIYAEAKRALAILDSSLVDLTIQSSQPGIRVMLDGEEWLSGPGRRSMKLLPGRHQMVASRRGYVTLSRALDLQAGKAATERVALAREQIRVVRQNYERRWAWWVPWSVAGAGLVVGLAGTGVYLDARADIRQYDRDLAALCPSGCPDDMIPGSLREDERKARQRSGIAIGMWSAGGALLVTGALMAILNRPQMQETRAATPLVTVSPDFVGIGVSLGLE